ncbi:MAG: hypothetical protein WC613_02760 [Candidatus Aenigmatarchaeota archaeon]
MLSLDIAWYILMLGFVVAWLILYKLNKKNNIKKDLSTGLLTVFIGLVVEIYAVSNGMWNYTAGNWPWQLWVSYFVSGLPFYQIVSRFIVK